MKQLTSNAELLKTTLEWNIQKLLILFFSWW